MNLKRKGEKRTRFVKSYVFADYVTRCPENKKNNKNWKERNYGRICIHLNQYYCPSFLSVAVLKYWPKTSWGGRGFFHWHFIVSHWVSQGRSSGKQEPGGEISWDDGGTLFTALSSAQIAPLNSPGLCPLAWHCPQWVRLSTSIQENTPRTHL